LKASPGPRIRSWAGWWGEGVMKVSDVSTWGTSSGKTHLIAHLKGEKLTQRQAILAMCCSCCCGYSDGRYSCEMPDCSLYPWMPYRKHKKPSETQVTVKGR
jgi:hypothetical protein